MRKFQLRKTKDVKPGASDFKTNIFDLHTKLHYHMLPWFREAKVITTITEIGLYAVLIFQTY